MDIKELTITAREIFLAGISDMTHPSGGTTAEAIHAAEQRLLGEAKRAWNIASMFHQAAGAVVQRRKISVRK